MTALMVGTLSLASCQDGRPIVRVMVAAGWRKPVEDHLTTLTATRGLSLRTSYAGSGQLVGAITMGQQADLFLAADASYLDDLATRQPLTGRLPIITQRAGLLIAPEAAVPTWDDLTSGRTSLSLARPETAAISRRTASELGPTRFEELRRGARIERSNVVEAANDAARLKLTEAALVWNTTAAAYPDRRFVPLEQIEGLRTAVLGQVQLGILSDRDDVSALAAALVDALAEDLQTTDLQATDLRATGRSR